MELFRIKNQHLKKELMKRQFLNIIWGIAMENKNLFKERANVWG